MTRDEAINKAQIAWLEENNAGPSLVNVLVSLGILKLDEPKSARDRFRDEMLREGYHHNSVGLRDAIACFDRAMAMTAR